MTVNIYTVHINDATSITNNNKIIMYMLITRHITI